MESLHEQDLRLPCSVKCAASATRTCHDCDELNELEEEIHEAEAVLREVNERRAAILEKVNAREDPLVSKLPVEIIRHVFDSFLEMHESKPNCDTLSTDSAAVRHFPFVHRRVPLSLGFVCRKWRRIAWSYSRLWQTLVIPLACPGYRLGPALVYEWLWRTGNEKLVIKLDCHRYNWSREPQYNPEHRNRLQMLECALRIVRLLNCVSHRWSGLHFSECPLEILSQLDDSVCTTPSVLQHLTLGGQIETVPEIPFEFPVFDKSIRVHSPTHLTLQFSALPGDVNISWHKLTDLFLEEMSLSALLRLLEHASLSSPALTCLSVRYIESRTEDSSINPAQRIRLPSLRNLLVDMAGQHSRFFRPKILDILLKSLTLPALEVFVDPTDDKDNQHFRERDFSDFLAHSECQLLTLRLSYPNMSSAEDLRSILWKMPSLQILDLKLRSDVETSKIFDWLDLPVPRFPPFLSSLREVNIDGPPPHSWRHLILMFAELSGKLDGGSFALPAQLVRKDLQLTVTLRKYEPKHAMDLEELSCMALLWTELKYFVVFKAFDRDGVEKNFFEESFRTSVVADHVNWESNQEYVGLHETLLAMSSLRFSI